MHDIAKKYVEISCTFVECVRLECFCRNLQPLPTFPPQIRSNQNLILERTGEIKFGQIIFSTIL